MMIEACMFVLVFVYGILIGSFLNVLILRIPLKENFVSKRSHCMQCGTQLKWFELIPLFSYIGLRGRCRTCKTRISVQYPLIEGLNGILYVLVFWKYGLTIETLLYCLLFSALLALSVIDFRTYEIPVGFNIFILILGLIHVALDLGHWADYVIGFVSVSVFLLLIYLLTKGRGIGGGGVKLMATCGLLVGYKLVILAFLLGCVLGAVIHLIRMRVSKAGRVLAMGPYLSLGIGIAVIFGNQLIQWYFGLMGIVI